MTETTTRTVPGFDRSLRQQATAENSRTAGHAATDVADHYLAALPPSYKDDTTPAQALTDIARLEQLVDSQLDDELTVDPADPGRLQLRLYRLDGGAALSELLPVVQSLGCAVIDQRSHTVVRGDGRTGWISVLGLRTPPPSRPGDVPAAGLPQETRRRIEDALRALWRGAAGVDELNALVLTGGLTWQDVVVLRATAAYLQQGGTPYSPGYVRRVLCEHPSVAAALVRWFYTRFDPAIPVAQAQAAAAEALTEVDDRIDAVAGLDADRILRHLRAIIDATVRTNLFQRDTTADDAALALKLDPRRLPFLPHPRPVHETFVYSPHVQGVHLRFGDVARGGLRWSDRHEDYRTEVLGLVTAQAVKNAVIVPAGAKGCFVVTAPTAPATPDDRLRRGRAGYRTFVGALLDITDTIDPTTGAVVAPDRVRRDDDDDPYLVVAADKGTATFSDLANEVATEHGFWLGDAFASGGSVGYDHKAMGITAKGAWESVKRHFRELGIDPHRDSVTVVGIGDMSGDVFGNGMLLSDRIRLVAAFDHRHIFLDPDPDPGRAHAERTRLFGLPRSSWLDYNPDLISAGGGVHPRTAKAIPISEPVRQVLGIPADVQTLTPDELIRAALTAPADLLWNGGIGTYVKACGETNTDVGDKANDAVRVDAPDLRVRVVGEGGNLGVTRRGRVEFARHGGRINTDALDNSAGVDCSDHEVNIKVLLADLRSTNRITATDRDALLAEMTDDVENLVLANNRNQNELLGISRVDPAGMIGVHGRLIEHLEQHHNLDRDLEQLPGRDELAAREHDGRGLTSPELATLIAHVKLALKRETLGTALPDAAPFTGTLLRYFPAVLAQRYPDAVARHRLRREIVTTVVVNDIVETGGISYPFRLREETGASAGDVLRAHAVAAELLNLPAIRRHIADLDTVAPVAVTDQLSLAVRRLLDRVTRWLLSALPQPLDVSGVVEQFRAAVTDTIPRRSTWLTPDAQRAHQADMQRLVHAGVPAAAARYLTDHIHAGDVVDMVEIAAATGAPVDIVGPLYLQLAHRFDIDTMTDAIRRLPHPDRWRHLSRLSLLDELSQALRSITIDALRSTPDDQPPAQRAAGWADTHATRIDRTRELLSQISFRNTSDLAALFVAVHQLGAVVPRTADHPPAAP